MRRLRRSKFAVLAPLGALCLSACGDAGNDGVVDPSATGPGTIAGPAMTLDGNGMQVPVGTVPSDGLGPGPGSIPGAAGGAAVPDPEGTASTPAGPGPGSTPVNPGDTLECGSIEPGEAPLRRLTRFEYNNTIEDLLGDDSRPANSLPPELLGNGFGNDGTEQPVSSFLAEQYGVVAEGIASRLDLASHFPCTTSVTPDTETSCAQFVVETFGSDAYRRDLEAGDVEELMTLYSELRANGSFEEAVRSLVSAILQSPNYLYRFEWGTPDAANPAVRRLTGREMAARLSYFFWGTMPDDQLEAAATAGDLDTPDGVRAQAARLLEHDRARPVLRYFFEHFLPINTVADLARDPEQYPSFNGQIGALMQEETRSFLEYLVFEGGGTWKEAFTAPYVIVNETLANYYGIPNVTGEEFRRVDVDPATTKRMGLLSQGAILAGTTISNFTNPVRRGGFIVRELMCQDIQLPAEEDVLDKVKPPEPFIPGQSSEVGRETARMRYEAHREIDSVCITCHAVLDPPGFALENFDAVGLWRDTENGVTIDATGESPLLGGAFDGPFELAQVLSENERVHACFARNWSEFAYGRKLDTGVLSDACLVQDLSNSFAASGYDIKELLLALTQTDAFLYLPAAEVTQ